MDVAEAPSECASLTSAVLVLNPDVSGEELVSEIRAVAEAELEEAKM